MHEKRKESYTQCMERKLFLMGENSLFLLEKIKV